VWCVVCVVCCVCMCVCVCVCSVCVWVCIDICSRNVSDSSTYFVLSQVVSIQTIHEISDCSL